MIRGFDGDGLSYHVTMSEGSTTYKVTYRINTRVANNQRLPDRVFVF